METCPSSTVERGFTGHRDPCKSIGGLIYGVRDEDMLSELSISIHHPITRSTIAKRRQDNLVFRPDHYNIHYLTAYLGAVAGCLSQRGLVIHAIARTPTPQSLGGTITFDPRQPAGFSAPAWVAYQASWDKHHGWCCQLHHIAKDQSRVRRYLGEPVVPAPEVVADFIAGMSHVQTLGTLGPARPAARGSHTPQELADDLIRFTPTCTWIG
jgi:hypothetical protein